MLSDTIQYFNNLSGGDEKQLNTLLDFSNQYMTNTLPPLTCLYGSGNNGITTLLRLLRDNPNICQTLNKNVIKYLRNDKPIIVNLDDKQIDHGLLKQIVHCEPMTIIRFGELPKQIVVTNAVIIVSHKKMILSDSINRRAQHIHFPVCFQHGHFYPTHNNVLFCDMMVNHKQIVRQHVKILPLFLLWCKLQ